MSFGFRVILGLMVLFVLAASFATASGPKGSAAVDTVFRNPIISGFSPDPSIVRVDSDFYLVNSSFEYFPALPIYHSTDLVNWSLISFALTDPHMIDFSSLQSSDGIQAATIRHHDGRFYVAATNASGKGLESFIVTASDPRGPWSAPIMVKDAVGIDPSLFFDDDGRVWYTASVKPPEPAFEGEKQIWLQELDPATLQLIGERRMVWSGCCRGGWAEGPHLYKRSGTYYLLLAEGGTNHQHAVSIASSDRVEGPYVGNPRNPILTHRHLSFDHPITGVGHADLVELADGRWFGVALGWRLVNGQHGILGRETFLFPVEWETERKWWRKDNKTYPVMSPLTGKIEAEYPIPLEKAQQDTLKKFIDEFDLPNLSNEWNGRRTHPTSFTDLKTKPGIARIRLAPAKIGENLAYSFMGIRQRHLSFSAEADMHFSPRSAHEEAGLVVIQNDRAALLLTRIEDGSEDYVILSRWADGERAELGRIPISKGDLSLRVDGNGLTYQFYLREKGGEWRRVGDPVDVAFMSPRSLQGFNYTGLFLGLYGSSNGAPSDNFADFGRFSYEPNVSVSPH